MTAPDGQHRHRKKNEVLLPLDTYDETTHKAGLKPGVVPGVNAPKADLTDDELDLLRADLKAQTGVDMTREAMSVSAMLIPPSYLERLKGGGPITSPARGHGPKRKRRRTTR